jgi:hypothetical protein
VLSRQVGGEPIHVAPRHVEADTRREPANHAKPVLIARRVRIAEELRQVEREPNVSVAHRTREAARHHADDLIWTLVEAKRTADHGGCSAELPSPDRVTQNHDVGAGVCIGQRPTQRGPDPKRREESPLAP